MSMSTHPAILVKATPQSSNRQAPAPLLAAAAAARRESATFVGADQSGLKRAGLGSVLCEGGLFETRTENAARARAIAVELDTDLDAARLGGAGKSAAEGEQLLAQAPGGELELAAGRRSSFSFAANHPAPADRKGVTGAGGEGGGGEGGGVKIAGGSGLSRLDELWLVSSFGLRTIATRPPLAIPRSRSRSRLSLSPSVRAMCTHTTRDARTSQLMSGACSSGEKSHCWRPSSVGS